MGIKHSCIYEGTVAHCRYRPVDHRFQYRLFMLYLDLGELPEMVGSGRVISDRKWSGRSLVRRDHLFSEVQTIESEVRDIVQLQTGQLPEGPIRMLTQLRYFGYYFSPLNLFYVFNREDTAVETVVAEVSNTPWKERHTYVLWDGNREVTSAPLQFCHPKTFHVSPFMAMEMQYRWQLSEPGIENRIHLANYEQSQKLFDATMSLTRRELSSAELRRMTFRYFFMTARIAGAIYYQAWKLWWKACPFYPHPKKLTTTSMQPPAETMTTR